MYVHDYLVMLLSQRSLTRCLIAVSFVFSRQTMRNHYISGTRCFGSPTISTLGGHKQGLFYEYLVPQPNGIIAILSGFRAT